jgi:hypothetical protein
MPPQLESAVRTDSLVVRTTFFGTSEILESEPGSQPELFKPTVLAPDSDSPNLDEVASALAGLHKALSFAAALTTADCRPDEDPPAPGTRALTLGEMEYARQRKFLADAREHGRSDVDWTVAEKIMGDRPQFAHLNSLQHLTRSPRHHDLYSVVSIKMRSPLQVAVAIPPEAYPALVPGLVLLAYKICRFGPRVSAARAKDLRDKAMYDQQKKLILEGKADAFAFVLAEHPMPDRMDFLGPGEDPDVVEMEQLSAPATDR